MERSTRRRSRESDAPGVPDAGAPRTVSVSAPAGAGVRCELATETDDAALRALLRDTPMEGWVRLAFPREPSYFGAAPLEGRRSATVVVRRVRDGAVVAMGSRSVKEVWMDGRPALLGYLGQLRFAPGWRAGRRTLVRGYALVRGVREEDELPFDLTAVVAGNEPARRLLERGLPGMPRYTPLGELVTRVVPTERRRRGWGSRGPLEACGVRVTDAARGDLLDAMADRLQREGGVFRLAPRWGRSRLQELAAGGSGGWHPLVALRGNEVVGCAAVWDQRAFRQCVVTGYSPWLGRLRPALAALSRLVGKPGLPPPGSALRLAFVSHWAADDPDAAEALVAVARVRGADLGLDHLALALPAGRPALLRRLRRGFGGHGYRSVLYAVHDPGDGEGPSGLGGADVQVEVATL